MATDMTVANTILAQLGGNRFIAMTGACSFSGSADELTFRLPTRGKMRAVKIKLEPSDTYTFRVVESRGSMAKGNFEIVETSKAEDVYCDMLEEVFTEATGLYTSLRVA